jgi:hypothetical protein
MLPVGIVAPMQRCDRGAESEPIDGAGFCGSTARAFAGPFVDYLSGLQVGSHAIDC